MTATLTPEEFNTLLRLAHAVDLIELRAQLELTRAVSRRDAYYAALAIRYGLPPRWAGLTWHDGTYAIDVLPQKETHEHLDQDRARVSQFPTAADRDA